MSNFSAPYFYTGRYKDEQQLEEIERATVRKEMKESDEARAKASMRKSLNVRIFATGPQLNAVQCLECGRHFVLFNNLCEHLQGKMSVICEAYGVFT